MVLSWFWVVVSGLDWLQWFWLGWLRVALAGFGWFRVVVGGFGSFHVLVCTHNLTLFQKMLLGESFSTSG